MSHIHPQHPLANGEAWELLQHQRVQDQRFPPALLFPRTGADGRRPLSENDVSHTDKTDHVLLLVHLLVPILSVVQEPCRTDSTRKLVCVRLF